MTIDMLSLHYIVSLQANVYTCSVLRNTPTSLHYVNVVDGRKSKVDLFPLTFSLDVGDVMEAVVVMETA